MTILRCTQTTHVTRMAGDDAMEITTPRLRNRPLAALCAVSLAATVLAPALVWAKPRPAHIRVETARLRSGPDESRHLVGLLDAGRTARVIERREGWARVRLQTGTEGWVRSDLVKISRSRKAEAAAEAFEAKQRAKARHLAAAHAKRQIAAVKAAKAAKARKIAAAAKAAHAKKVAAAAKAVRVKKMAAAAAAKSARAKQIAAAARIAQAKKLAAARARAQQIAADRARTLKAKQIAQAQAKEAALRAEKIARAEALLRPATPREPAEAGVPDVGIPAQTAASRPVPERSVRTLDPRTAVAAANTPDAAGEAVRVVEPVVPVEGAAGEPATAAQTPGSPEPRGSDATVAPAVPVKVTKTVKPTRGEHMVRTALTYRGTPYRFGARGNGAFDCSGFTWYIWRKAGSPLPRTAAQQYRRGVRIPKDRMQAGDLVFFKNTYKRGVSHVGVYVGNGEFVHASSGGRQVRVDPLSKPYYVHHWAGARRMSNTGQKAR